MNITTQEQVAQLQKLGAELIDFHNADCPVNATHDTYPPDLWAAATRPDCLLPLLAELTKSAESDSTRNMLAAKKCKLLVVEYAESVASYTLNMWLVRNGRRPATEFEPQRRPSSACVDAAIDHLAPYA